MILYVISVGLSVTMGLMGFANLAHGVFAMAGGYVLTTAISRFGVPFPIALALAFAFVAAASVVLERILYSRLYTASDLEQVLFTIGLIFIAVAVARFIYGTLQQPVVLPDYLKGHGARGGGQPRHGAVGRNRHPAPVHAHLRARQRARGAGRRARRGDHRDPAHLPVREPRVFSGGRGCGRPGQPARAVRGGAPHRYRRHR